MALNARRFGLLAYLPLMMLAMTGEPTSVIPAPRDDADAIARQEQLITRVRDAKGAVPVVFVGDSITQSWDAPGKEVWDTRRGDCARDHHDVRIAQPASDR